MQKFNHVIRYSSAAAQLELMKERVSPRHLEEINQLRLLLAKVRVYYILAYDINNIAS